jgi:hypothetical protein
MAEPLSDRSSAHLDVEHSGTPAETLKILRKVPERTYQKEQQSELPTPNTPPTRLTRKRTVSINTGASKDTHITDLVPSSASTAGSRISESGREQVCLCQPDPKIPRPRNGVYTLFIPYVLL